MSQLTDLVAEVLTLTGRPDLSVEATLEVRNSTLRAHRSDEYHRDLVESAVSFAGANYVQSFEYKLTFPRWRRLRYMRFYDQINQAAGKNFQIIDPADALNQYGNTRVDVAYPAGTVYNLRGNFPFDAVLVGFFQDPDVTVTGYSSWIASEHPFLITYLASASLLKLIGRQEDSKAFEQHAAMLLHDLKADNVLPLG